MNRHTTRRLKPVSLIMAGQMLWFQVGVPIATAAEAVRAPVTSLSGFGAQLQRDLAVNLGPLGLQNLAILGRRLVDALGVVPAAGPGAHSVDGLVGEHAAAYAARYGRDLTPEERTALRERWQRLQTAIEQALGNQQDVQVAVLLDEVGHPALLYDGVVNTPVHQELVAYGASTEIKRVFLDAIQVEELLKEETGQELLRAILQRKRAEVLSAPHALEPDRKLEEQVNPVVSRITQRVLNDPQRQQARKALLEARQATAVQAARKRDQEEEPREYRMRLGARFLNNRVPDEILKDIQNRLEQLKADGTLETGTIVQQGEEQVVTVSYRGPRLTPIIDGIVVDLVTDSFSAFHASGEPATNVVPLRLPQTPLAYDRLIDDRHRSAIDFALITTRQLGVPQERLQGVRDVLARVRLGELTPQGGVDELARLGIEPDLAWALVRQAVELVAMAPAQGDELSERAGPSGQKQGTARLLFSPHADPRDIAIREGTWQAFLKRSHRPVFHHEDTGPSPEEAKAFAQLLRVSFERLITDAAYRDEAQRLFNQFEESKAKIERLLREQPGVIEQRLRSFSAGRLTPEQRYILDRAALLQRFGGHPIRFERPAFEAWLASMRIYLHYERAQERFEHSDIRGYLQERTAQRRAIRENLRLRNRAIVSQIEAELNAGQDVIMDIGRQHWEVARLLQSHGHAVEVDQDVRAEDFVPGGELLYREATGETVPRATAELLILRDHISDRFLTYLERTEDTVTFFRRLRALVNLWPRDAIVHFSRQYQTLIGREADGVAFLRYFLGLALSRHGQALGRATEAVRAASDAVAARMDQSALGRLRQHLSTATLPLDSDDLSRAIYEWVLRDQGWRGNVWLTESDQQTITGRVAALTSAPRAVSPELKPLRQALTAKLPRRIHYLVDEVQPSEWARIARDQGGASLLEALQRFTQQRQVKDSLVGQPEAKAEELLQLFQIPGLLLPPITGSSGAAQADELSREELDGLLGQLRALRRVISLDIREQGQTTPVEVLLISQGARWHVLIRVPEGTTPLQIALALLDKTTVDLPEVALAIALFLEAKGIPSGVSLAELTEWVALIDLIEVELPPSSSTLLRAAQLVRANVEGTRRSFFYNEHLQHLVALADRDATPAQVIQALLGNTNIPAAIHESLLALIQAHLPHLLPPSVRGSSGAPTGAEEQGPGLRILVVDDEPLVAEVLEQFLYGSVEGGVQVVRAGSGEEAVSLLDTQGPFDAVFSDLNMPGMSGAVLLQRVQELAPETRLALVTGNRYQAEPALEQAGFAPEAVPILGKPFRETQVRQRLRRMIVERFSDLVGKQRSAAEVDRGVLERLVALSRTLAPEDFTEAEAATVGDSLRVLIAGLLRTPGFQADGRQLNTFLTQTLGQEGVEGGKAFSDEELRRKGEEALKKQEGFLEGTRSSQTPPIIVGASGATTDEEVDILSPRMAVGATIPSLIVPDEAAEGVKPALTVDNPFRAPVQLTAGQGLQLLRETLQDGQIIPIYVVTGLPDSAGTPSPTLPLTKQGEQLRIREEPKWVTLPKGAEDYFFIDAKGRLALVHPEGEAGRNLPPLGAVRVVSARAMRPDMVQLFEGLRQGKQNPIEAVDLLAVIWGAVPDRASAMQWVSEALPWDYYKKSPPTFGTSGTSDRRLERGLGWDEVEQLIRQRVADSTTPMGVWFRVDPGLAGVAVRYRDGLLELVRGPEVTPEEFLAWFVRRTDLPEAVRRSVQEPLGMFVSERVPSLGLAQVSGGLGLSSEELAASYVEQGRFDKVAELGEVAIPFLLPSLGHADSERNDGASYALVAIGPAVIPAVDQAFREGTDARVKEAALKVLGNLKANFSGTAVVEGLLEALQANLQLDQENREHAFRQGLVYALRFTTDPGVIQVLIDRLGDAYPWVRYYAVRGLKHSGTPEALQALEARLPDEQREGAGWIASEIGKAIEALKRDDQRQGQVTDDDLQRLRGVSFSRRQERSGTPVTIAPRTPFGNLIVTAEQKASQGQILQVLRDTPEVPAFIKDQTTRLLERDERSRTQQDWSTQAWQKVYRLYDRLKDELKIVVGHSLVSGEVSSGTGNRVAGAQFWESRLGDYEGVLIVTLGPEATPEAALGSVLEKLPESKHQSFQQMALADAPELLPSAPLSGGDQTTPGSEADRLILYAGQQAVVPSRPARVPLKEEFVGVDGRITSHALHVRYLRWAQQFGALFSERLEAMAGPGSQDVALDQLLARLQEQFHASAREMLRAFWERIERGEGEGADSWLRYEDLAQALRIDIGEQRAPSLGVAFGSRRLAMLFRREAMASGFYLYELLEADDPERTVPLLGVELRGGGQPGGIWQVIPNKLILYAHFAQALSDVYRAEAEVNPDVPETTALLRALLRVERARVEWVNKQLPALEHRLRVEQAREGKSYSGIIGRLNALSPKATGTAEDLRLMHQLASQSYLVGLAEQGEGLKDLARFLWFSRVFRAQHYVSETTRLQRNESDFLEWVTQLVQDQVGRGDGQGDLAWLKPEKIKPLVAAIVKLDRSLDPYRQWVPSPTPLAGEPSGSIRLLEDELAHAQDPQERIGKAQALTQQLRQALDNATRGGRGDAAYLLHSLAYQLWAGLQGDLDVRRAMAESLAAELRREDVPAEALDQAKTPLALWLLTRVLYDRDPAVRWQATSILDGVGWRPRSPYDRAAYHVARQEFATATGYGSAAIPALISLLYSSDRERSGDEASQQARAALVTINDPSSTIPALLPLLSSPNPILRDDAVEILRGLAAPITDPMIVHVLFGALEVADSDQRRADIARVLGYVRHPRAIERLALLLAHDNEAMVRAAAAQGLGATDDPAAATEVLKFQRNQETSPDVQRAIGEALVRLTEYPRPEAPFRKLLFAGQQPPSPAELASLPLVGPLVIGVPTEIKNEHLGRAGRENRVGGTPDAVAQLTAQDHRVIVQAGAGEGSGYSDEEYRRAGAEIAPDEQAVYEQAQLILKVKELQPREFELVGPQHLIFTYEHFEDWALGDFLAFMKRQATPISYEKVREINAQGRKRTVLLDPMSAIGGWLAALLIAQGLTAGAPSVSMTLPQAALQRLNAAETDEEVREVLQAELAGKLTGRSVVILGGGPVGTNAAEWAARAGANVILSELDAQRQDELKAQFTSLGLPVTVTYLDRDALTEALERADAVVEAVYVGAEAPKLVDAAMLEELSRRRGGRPPLLSIDVSVDQGGNAEFVASGETQPSKKTTTLTEPAAADRFGNIHVRVPHMPSWVPRLASRKLSEATVRYVELLAQGGLSAAVRNPALLEAVATFRGHWVVDPGVLQHLQKLGITLPSLSKEEVARQVEVGAVDSVLTQGGRDPGAASRSGLTQLTQKDRERLDDLGKKLPLNPLLEAAAERSGRPRTELAQRVQQVLEEVVLDTRSKAAAITALEGIIDRDPAVKATDQAIEFGRQKRRQALNQLLGGQLLGVWASLRAQGSQEDLARVEFHRISVDSSGEVETSVHQTSSQETGQPPMTTKTLMVKAAYNAPEDAVLRAVYEKLSDRARRAFLEKVRRMAPGIGLAWADLERLPGIRLIREGEGGELTVRTHEPAGPTDAWRGFDVIVPSGQTILQALRAMLMAEPLSVPSHDAAMALLRQKAPEMLPPVLAGGASLEVEEQVPAEELAIPIKFGTAGWRVTTATSGPDAGFTIGNASRMAQAIADMARERSLRPPGQVRVAVGYDARPGGRVAAIRIVEILAANDIHADLIDQVTPSPVMSEATRKNQPEAERYDLAVHVTASHNPLYASLEPLLLWQGIKVFENGVPGGDELTGLIVARANDQARNATYRRVPYDQIQTLTTRGVDLIARSHARLRGSFDFEALRGKTPRLHVDSMYGASGEWAKIFDGLGTVVSRVRTEPLSRISQEGTQPVTVTDPQTGQPMSYAPDPTKRIFTQALVDQMQPGEMAIFLDGDADRDVEIEKDAQGREIELTPNDLGLIKAHYLYHSRGVRGVLVRTLPTSSRLDRFARRVGLRVIETPVGSKHFAPYADEGSPEKLLLAQEESGHTAFQVGGKIYVDSSVANVLLTLEIVTTTGKSLKEYLAGIDEEERSQTGDVLQYRRGEVQQSLVTPELKQRLLALRQQRAQEFAETLAQRLNKPLRLDDEGRVAAGVSFDTTDPTGVLVRFADDSRAMYRVSGTENVVRLYGEEFTEERLRAQERAVSDVLLELTLEPPSPAPSQLVIDRGLAYHKGELQTSPIAVPFRPSRQEDVVSIPDLPDAERRRYLLTAVQSVAKGEGVFGVLGAGMGARMPVTQTPPKVQELVRQMFGEDHQLLSKAAVPIGVADGEVYTFLGAFLINVRRLEEAASRWAGQSDLPPNGKLIFTNAEYAEELAQERRLRGDYRVSGLIDTPQQALGEQYVATSADTRRFAGALGEEQFARALALAEAVDRRIQAGHPEVVVLPGESTALGHGEFLHQAVTDGRLLRWLKDGVPWITARNIDNSAGTFDEDWLVALGMFLEEDLDFLAEVSPRTPGQRGGAMIITQDGSHQLAEDPSVEATWQAVVEEMQAQGFGRPGAGELAQGLTQAGLGEERAARIAHQLLDRQGEPEEVLKGAGLTPEHQAEVRALLARVLEGATSLVLEALERDGRVELVPYRMDVDGALTITDRQQLTEGLRNGAYQFFRRTTDGALQGVRRVTSQSTYWFNDAMAIIRPRYWFYLYGKEGQTLEEFTQELDSATPEQLEAIAGRGRRKFPSLVDPKPAKTRDAVAVKIETNMWQSTGVAAPGARIKTVGVMSAFNVPPGEAFAQMTPEEQHQVVKHLRMLATKQWRGPAESYEANTPFFPAVLDYILHGELIPADLPGPAHLPPIAGGSGAADATPSGQAPEPVAPSHEQRIYSFGAGQTEGGGAMKDLLGGKGANLAEMAQLGLPVPPGFTITTRVAMAYLRNDAFQFPEGLQEEIDAALARLEAVRGKRLGDPDDPLLVSVRSGARVSMPGMMDTVLNLGLNDQSVEGLSRRTSNPRFAYNSYARLIEMFGDVVLGIERRRFTELTERHKAQRGVTADTGLTADDYRELVREFKQAVRDVTGSDFPQDPRSQLRLAIEAVFRSSNNERAKTYRRLHRLPDDTVSAVNVQSMVFGNTGDGSATGVAFTRDPATGAKGLMGEFLVNAQGEDVVAGIRTPTPMEALARTMPEAYRQLSAIGQQLEQHAREMQDIEFTIEDGTLYMLQTRDGKRSARSMLRIAVDMAEEGLIAPEEALARIDLARIERELMHPTLDPDAANAAPQLGTGVAASPGAGVGRAVFNSKDAEEWARRGERVILVRKETSPEDLGGMVASAGILTAHGGATSHAALVARGEGIPAVVGVGALSVDYDAKRAVITGKDLVIREGDWVTIDGTTGAVYLGRLPTVPSEIERVEEGAMRAEDSRLYQDYATLLLWADEVRALGVWTNADTPKDVRWAIQLGAEGIGLTRTEHMFRDIKDPDGAVVEPRLVAVQTMFLSKEGSAERDQILLEIGGMQRRDFEAILGELHGRPATIRLLDPPVNEFVPKVEDEEAVRAIAERLRVGSDEVKRRIAQTHEVNPMLGSRGVRLLLLNPSILRMQVRAMVGAYATLVKQGERPKLKIMVPNVMILDEYLLAKRIIASVVGEVLDQEGIAAEDRRGIEIGTMIEQPSAALTAARLAAEASFFSFGTNDLTQFTFGMSRDDAAKGFLPFYLEHGIFKADPTQKLDAEAVARLVRIAVEEGRSANPSLEIGICGEHGGEPESIELFHQAGLTYVSASPKRIPIARLAAAQAQIKHPRAFPPRTGAPTPGTSTWRHTAASMALLEKMKLRWLASEFLAPAGQRGRFEELFKDGGQERGGWVHRIEEVLGTPWPEEIEAEVRRLKEQGVEALGFVGMGGESSIIGSISGSPTASLLNIGSTAPAKWTRLLEGRELSKMRWYVVSKSGSTTETRRNAEYLERRYLQAGLEAKDHITYVTDPGTELERLKAGQGFVVKRRELNSQTSIGGRNTLANYPTLLAERWWRDYERLRGMLTTVRETHAFADLADDPWIKAAVEAAPLISGGRRKVALIQPESIRQAQWVWEQQNPEESLGKQGKGFTVFTTPPDLATLRRMQDGGWLFVEFRLPQPHGFAEPARQYAEQARADGHPVITIEVPEVPNASWRSIDFGRQITAYGWMKFVAMLGGLWEVNFSDQPPVEAYKALMRSKQLTLDDAIHPAEEQQAVASGGGVTLVYDGLLPFLSEPQRAELARLLADDASPAEKIYAKLLEFTRAQLDTQTLAYYDDVDNRAGPWLDHVTQEILHRGMGYAAKWGEGSGVLHGLFVNWYSGPLHQIPIHIVSRQHALRPDPAYPDGSRTLIESAVAAHRALVGARRPSVMLVVDDPLDERTRGRVQGFFKQVGLILAQAHTPTAAAGAPTGSRPTGASPSEEGPGRGALSALSYPERIEALGIRANGEVPSRKGQWANVDGVKQAAMHRLSETSIRRAVNAEEPTLVVLHDSVLLQPDGSLAFEAVEEQLALVHGAVYVVVAVDGTSTVEQADAMATKLADMAGLTREQIIPIPADEAGIAQWHRLLTAATNGEVATVVGPGQWANAWAKAVGASAAGTAASEVTVVACEPSTATEFSSAAVAVIAGFEAAGNRKLPPDLAGRLEDLGKALRVPRVKVVDEEMRGAVAEGRRRRKVLQELFGVAA